MEKEKQVVKLTLKLKDSKNYREYICAWLHEKAEEIKNLKDEEYVENPSWTFTI